MAVFEQDLGGYSGTQEINLKHFAFWRESRFGHKSNLTVRENLNAFLHP